MTDIVAVALIGGLAQVVCAAIIYRKVDKVHTEMNGMQSKLIDSTARASDAEGHARGVLDQQAKDKPPV